MSEVCKDCQDPAAGIALDGRCRECDLEYAMEMTRCQSCGWLLWNEMGRHLFGVYGGAHDDKFNCPWVAL